MDVTRSINCNELRNCDVVDSSGERVGRIDDVTFTFDGSLKLKQFILAGSRWEELLESAKIKPDKDHLLDADLITRIGDRVQLSTNVNSLKTTLDAGAISADEIRWSDLTKMDIYDHDDVKVGRAVDIDFDLDGSASLIVGGGMIEEALESVGLKSDIDIIVPAKAIASMSDKIKLTVSKDDLKLTMAKALENPEVKKARDLPADKRAAAKVRLYY
ncbi:MAG: PRC-barrel domain-containing protein [Candidatus Thorarchaeota archaeon]